MKWILILLFFISTDVSAQTARYWPNHDDTTLVWDSTVYYCTCPLRWKCTQRSLHYKLIRDFTEKESNGTPVYGPELGLLGLVNEKRELILIKKRNHLIGHPTDIELLNNKSKLRAWLSQTWGDYIKLSN